MLAGNASMFDPGYSETFRGVRRSDRLAPNCVHSNENVCFDAVFACLPPTPDVLREGRVGLKLAHNGHW